MRRCNFQKATFVKSATKAKDFPTIRDLSGEILPEVAVAGRSNVGKSSLLNHLFQAKGLVKTSSVPGKTQLINFFSIDDTLAFVDLPGYGFAKVPDSVRKEWGPMMQDYLEKRPPLKLILFLFDIRREPNQDDHKFMEWLLHSEKAVILVFTKIDKVKKNELKANTQKILKSFNLQNLHHIHYSVPENVGRQELIKMLVDAVEDESQNEMEP